MEYESLGSDWNWDDPVLCTGRLDEVRADSARCEKLEVIADDPPFSRRRLREIGVSGIEFAAFQSTHPSGLAADYVPIECSGKETAPGELYRLDGEFAFV